MIRRTGYLALVCVMAGAHPLRLRRQPVGAAGVGRLRGLLPLADAEFRTIADNVAPYLR